MAEGQAPPEEHYRAEAQGSIQCDVDWNRRRMEPTADAMAFERQSDEPVAEEWHEQAEKESALPSPEPGGEQRLKQDVSHSPESCPKSEGEALRHA